MATPLQPPSEEPDYGAVQQQAALIANAPPAAPDQPTNQQIDQMVQQTIQPPQTDQVQQPAPTPEAPAEAQAKPPNKAAIPSQWRIPHNYSGIFGEPQGMTRQRLEDVGSMWDVLAKDPKVDPTVRAIADSLVRGK